MDEKQGDITLLLQAWRAGSPGAENQLFELVAEELRRIARMLMNRERRGHSMQATELVDQIYFRLVAAKNQDWQSRRHFYAIAGKAMRRYLIDHARRRPGVHFVDIGLAEDKLAKYDGSLETTLTIDTLLDQLRETDPDMCCAVELKYFLGLTDREASEVLGVNQRRLKRLWHNARLWLFDRMDPGAWETGNDTGPRIA